MSYDVEIIAPRCHASHNHNHTSNMAGAWDAAGAPLREWDRKPVAEILPALRSAIAELTKHPDRYRKYEPDNGWGTVRSAREFLQDIEYDCARHEDDGVLVVFR